MLTRFALLVLWIHLVGCTLYDRDPPRCLGNGSPPTQAHQLVNPETLLCEEFFTSTCDNACGPCPQTAAGADLLPTIPSWGSCDSACERKTEAQCEAAPQCRVARDWRNYYQTTSASFLGCYPLDMAPQTSNSCKGLGAQDCSRRNACTALYKEIAADCVGCAIHEFAECIPEKQQVGSCVGTLTCDIAQPPCPDGTTPGIANGCYTLACIPNELCIYPLD